VCLIIPPTEKLPRETLYVFISDPVQERLLSEGEYEGLTRGREGVTSTCFLNCQNRILFTIHIKGDVKLKKNIVVA
jgi:hypothetical protein